MDADTRHQLKQNELAQALRQLWDFSDRRTAAWLAVILVVALAYAGYKVWGWRQQVEVTGAYQTLRSVRVSDASRGDAPLAQLRQLIADNSQPGLVAMSRLQLARGLEARGGDAADAAELSEAESEYKALLDTADAPNHLKAIAAFRLGMLYEAKRDFAKAGETYLSLSRNSGFRGSPFADLATTRLGRLDDLAVPIKFELGFKPLATTQPAPQPVNIERVSEGVGEEFVGPPVAPIRQPAREAPTGQRPPAPTTQPAAGRQMPADAPPAESSRPQQP